MSRFDLSFSPGGDTVLHVELAPVPDDAPLSVAGDGDSDGRHAPDRRALAVIARSGPDDVARGELAGNLAWGWLHVERLWVATDTPCDSSGELGLRSALLWQAEAEAVRLGCIGAWLDMTDAAGAVLHDERLGRAHDSRAKAGVVHSEMLPPESAPERWRDRDVLWNEAEWSGASAARTPSSRVTWRSRCRLS